MKKLLTIVLSLIVGYFFTLMIYPEISIVDYFNPFIFVSISCMAYFFLSGFLTGQDAFDHYVFLIGAIIWIYATYYNPSMRLKFPHESNPAQYYYFLPTLVVPFIVRHHLPITKTILYLLVNVGIASIMGFTHPLNFDTYRLAYLNIGIIVGIVFQLIIFFLKAQAMTKSMMKHLK